jgi:hypothetical protein
MPTVRNTDDHRRIWPGLRRADGGPLELDPGEEAEVAEHPGQVAHLLVKKARPNDKPADTE